MHPYLNTAIKAARAAGSIIARSANRLDMVSVQQKDANDFVTQVDQAAEEEIIRILRRAYPDHGFLAEESGASDSESEFTWVIDPLDGTTNFIHGIPQYAVSIALKQGKRLEQAVIYDPIKEELFTASRGGGAMLNNRRIRVSDRKDLNGVLLGTGIPFRAHHDLDFFIEALRALLPGTAGVRRAGAASLDLAYVACGRLDGFWESDLNQWDIAAGALIVQEAGGLVGDLSGGERFLESGNIVAASPKVFKGMLQRLHPLINKTA
ncbi:myo-inositol-1(or 4)-monophosphatase [Ectothiorhodosinus mongolicus]|uniref:Inositol-1-monophosphatase n=1 Tax=Ectothiorhodosinus mongolicus TaxID=233100 RepID=A0A1R3W6P6_9GAMM|nr:inositol monophosphatase family protein [Ectothiorhodosinus mongolicus]ULX57651.1 inositol monophosphatase [Ectothiorhodosinus mongolicus]SIT73299.1 myo-inositol-1(or 4)-monophosphatase [Ectothiorhodosinus mongolicus]